MSALAPSPVRRAECRRLSVSNGLLNVEAGPKALYRGLNAVTEIVDLDDDEEDEDD